MDKKIIKFDGTEIEEYKFHQNKSPILINDMDNDKEHVMHSKSDNMEIMINHEADEVMKELFDSLKN